MEATSGSAPTEGTATADGVDADVAPDLGPGIGPGLAAGRRDLRPTFELWVRSLVPSALLLLAAVVAMAVALVPLYIWSANAALTLGFSDADHITPRQLTELLIAVLVPFCVVLAVLTATLVGGVAIVGARISQGLPARPMGAFRSALRRSPRVAVSLAVVLASVLAAFVATPFLVLVGVIALVITPLVHLLQRRWSRVPWPATRSLVVVAIPFGLAAALVVRWALVLPAVILERRSIWGSFERSVALTRSHAARVGVLAGVFFVLPLAVVGLIDHHVVADATAVVGPQLLSTTAGLVVMTLAVIAMTYLFTQLGDPADLAVAEPAPPGGTRSMGALVVFAVLAAAVPVGLAWSRPAAASGSGATIVVDDLGDAPDADPGDSICATDTGTCTLRAALAVANQSSGEVIGFAVDGTIDVGSTLRIASPLTIDGSGRRVTLDGGGTVGVLATAIEVSGGGSATVRSITIAHGYDASTGGGAIFNSSASGGEGLVLDGVTVRDTTSAPGAAFGGAVVNVSKLTVRNSTFSGNVADPATDGSDVANVFSGRATISQSTFVGSTGSSAVASSSDDPIAITNSIVSGAGFGCSGTFTGSGNVTTDASEICPGAFGATAATLGLTDLADNGGPTDTARLLPTSAAVDAGDPAACAGVDQRGATRPKGAGCDAGSYELDPTTTTSLTATPTSAAVGAAITIGATVAAAGEPVVPTGKVELFDGTTSLGLVDLDGSGTATKVLTTLAAGSHDLTATYLPGSALTASTSAVRTVTIAPAATTVTLTSSGSPTSGGQPVTFHVVVAGSSGSVPTGTVTLRDGATTLTTATLDAAGTADYVTTSLAGGPHSIVASYSGDASNEAASSLPLAHEVVGSTTTKLQAPSTATTYGNDAVFEVEVTADGGGSTPTGFVSLVAGAATVGSAALDASGRAEVTVTSLPPGSNSVVATYAGDSFNGSSSSTAVTHDVRAADTATSFTVSPSPSNVYGTDLTVAIAVTASGTPAIPSGIVTIYDGTTVVLNVGLDPDGTYRTKLPVLATGSHALRAEYSGPVGFRASTSTVVAHEVLAASSAVALTAGSDRSVTGELVSLSAAVTSPDSPLVPVGTVTFRDGGTDLGTVAIDAAGVAHLDTRSIAVGDRNLTARFNGGPDFSAKTSPVLAHAVDRADVQVAVSSAPNRSRFGSAVVISVVVTAATPGSGVPTGTMTIRDGAAVLGTVTLDGAGSASLTVDSIGVGDRTLHADYAGDGAFRAGSGTASQTVDPDAATVTVLSSEPDQLYGRPITFTAVVLGTGSAIPTGSVTFRAGARTLGTATIDGSGRADLTVSDLAVGSTQIVATFDGDGTFTGGTGVRAQQVSAGPTSTTLAVSPNAPSVDDLVTLTATVTAPGATLAPTGSVGFYDNGTLIGTVAIDGLGRATLSQHFDRSQHELQARFLATTSWQGSGSAFRTIVPGQLDASLAVSATPSTALVGASVTLRAEVPTAAGATAPTGVIHFTDASGALGSAPLVAGVATLTVTAPLVPGPWVVSAWYPGDANYVPVAPTATTVTVGAAPTAVTVVSTPNPGRARDGDVTVRAFVTSDYRGAPLTGTVRFTSDLPALAGEDAPVAADGTAEITIRDVPAGSWALRAEYRPAGGSPFAGSNGATTHTSVKRAATVAITDVAGRKVGRPTRITASVADPDEATARPTGTIRVDVGGGRTCDIAAPSGSCEVTIPTAGPITVTATYSGDGTYLADGDVLVTTITTSTPILRLSSPTRRWTTGDPITIDWTLGGPTTGTLTLRTPFGEVCTVPAAPSGSCSTTIPFEHRGATFDVDAAYSGNDSWDPAYASLGGSVVGCYPVPFEALPKGSGTVTGPTGNCNRDAGFVAGTMVTAIAAPAPGYVLDRWLETDGTALAYRFAVGEDTHSATAVFAQDCVTVTTRAAQAPNVEPLGSASGRIDLSAPPDCGAAGRFDPVTGTTTSGYVRGTTIRATAVAASTTTGSFKGWAVGEATGAVSYPTAATIDLTLTGDVDLTANFGARCYAPKVVADGPGTAQIGTAPNCFDGLGKGYVFGTQVKIEASPGAYHYVGPMATGTGAFVEPTAYGVRSDDSIVVTFDPCRQLTTAVSGSGRGSVDVSVPSTCPAGEPGWYVPGEIELTPVASPGYVGHLGLPVEPDRFKRWVDGDGLPLNERAPVLHLDMSQDRDITAVFTSPSRCATVTLKSNQPDWVGGLKVSQDASMECNGPDEYVQGEPFSLTASALQGSPLIQWKVSGSADYLSAAMSGKTTKIADRIGYRSQLPGATSTVAKMYGDVTATAYACAAITPDVSLRDADGNAVEGDAPDNFVRFDNAATCPGTGNGWLVGDTVAYLAGAQPVGYEFQRWEGDVSGTADEGEITLDGSRPNTILRSVYGVHCFSLTVTPVANTARGVDPNCPGADPSANEYVGGTTVAVHAFDGGEVWVGWEGDAARSEDPSWVYVDKDSAANAKWRSRTTNEKIEDFFTDVGDVLAVGAKKLVGVAIIAATALLDSAFTAVVGLISLAASAIDAIAGAAGSPTDAGFREAMAGIQQTAALFSSPFSCGAEWAFADGSKTGDGSSLDGTGGDLKDALKDPKKLNDKLTNYRSSIEEIEESSTGYMAKLKKFGVQAKVAKSVGGTAMTAVGIGTAVASDDFGFESTASEAWGSESGRAFMGCMENSLPDYWNVPPLGYA